MSFILSESSIHLDKIWTKIQIVTHSFIWATCRLIVSTCWVFRITKVSLRKKEEVWRITTRWFPPIQPDTTMGPQESTSFYIPLRYVHLSITPNTRILLRNSQGEFPNRATRNKVRPRIPLPSLSLRTMLNPHWPQTLSKQREPLSMTQRKKGRYMVIGWLRNSVIYAENSALGQK